MARSLIGLGSNLGDRAAFLHQALQLLPQFVGSVQVASRFYPTQPVGGPSTQSEYLNAAAVCESALSPAEVLTALQAIEQQCGRQRNQRWDSRTLDLDLLLFDQLVLGTPQLTLPHPRMAFRRFVLQPATEIAPQMIHPTTQFALCELLQRLDANPICVVVLGDAAELIAREAAERTGSVALLRSSFAAGDPAKPDELLELVRQVSEKWNAAVGNRPPAIISDFWIGEFEAVARQAAIVVPQAITSPHLVVWLETEQLPGQPGKSEELRQKVFRPRQFPVLVLHRPSTATAALEIVAAIEAME